MSDRIDFTRPLKQRCGRAVKVLEPPEGATTIVGYYQDQSGYWLSDEWLLDGRRVGCVAENPIDLVYADEIRLQVGRRYRIQEEVDGYTHIDVVSINENRSFPFRCLLVNPTTGKHSMCPEYYNRIGKYASWSPSRYDAVEDCGPILQPLTLESIAARLDAIEQKIGGGE